MHGGISTRSSGRGLECSPAPSPGKPSRMGVLALRQPENRRDKARAKVPRLLSVHAAVTGGQGLKRNATAQPLLGG